MNKEQAQLRDGLLDLAAFIEQHPDVIPDWITVSIGVYRPLKEIVKKGYGRMTKEVSDSYFKLIRSFSPRVNIRFVQEREELCKRVKVGERTLPAEPEQVIAAVPERVIPAEPERIIPAKPERVEDIYEWVCPELIASQPNDDDLAAEAEAEKAAEEFVPISIEAMATAEGRESAPIDAMPF